MDQIEPKPRSALTRERVLATAIELADQTGIDSLSMRKLGRELGVEAMSLYNYVANKDDLLDAMLEAVVDEYQLPPDGIGWRRTIRELSLSAHAVLLLHPWAPMMLASRPNTPGVAFLRYTETLLGALREGGFSAEQTHNAFHALDGHIIGFTIREVTFPFDAEELKTVGSEFLEALSHAEYPYLAEHVKGHLEGDFAGGSGFEFGLDLILDGLERTPDSP